MRKQVTLSVIALLAATVVLVAGLNALGGLGAHGSGPGAAERAAAPASTSGKEPEPRPACPAGAVADVGLECLGATPESVGTSLEEGVAVVNVWAWWCEPCRAELPIFDEFARAHPEFHVVGVHADANAANGAAMLNDLGVDLPSFQDDTNQFAATLGLPSVVPITVVVMDGAQVATFPRTFSSVDELERAVAEAV